MVWNSVIAMTIVDVLIFLTVVMAFRNYFKHRKQIDASGGVTGAMWILFGLSTVALFYLGDFVTMHVFPLFTSRADSRAAMMFMHQHLAWYFMTAAIVSLMLGFRSSSATTVLLLNKLREKQDELARIIHGAA